MKRWSLALVCACVAVGCSKQYSYATHKNPDGGVPSLPFTTYTLDTSALPDGGAPYLPSSIPQISMAIRPDDTVGVAFFAPNGIGDGGVQLYDLRYISWQGGTTNGAETVRNLKNLAGVSLAFQPSGEPAIAYLGGGYDGPGDPSPYWSQSAVAISYRVNGTWTEQVAVKASNEAMCGNAVSDTGWLVGIDAALAFIQGQAYLAYRDAHFGQSVGTGDYLAADLELVSGSPASWTHAPIICGGSVKAGFGGHNDMIVGPDGQPVVVSDEQTAADISGHNVTFRQRKTDGTWQVPAHEPFTDLSDAEKLTSTQSGPSVSYDPQLGYGIAAVNTTTNKLYYVESTTPLSTWSVSDPVVASGTQGWYPSLAMDTNLHQPNIAFYDCSPASGQAEGSCQAGQDSLKIATRIATTWNFGIVDPGGGFLPRLGFLSTGKRVVVYRDPHGVGALKLSVER